MKIYTGDTYWTCDFEERSCSFIAKDEVSEGKVILQLNPGNEVSFLGLPLWLAQRRHQWSEWRRNAELEGSSKLQEHLSGLLVSAESSHQINAGVVTFGQNDRSELTIAALYNDAKQRAEVARHRFETDELRSAFLDWYRSPEEPSGPLELSIIGLLQGCETVIDRMNQIAHDWLPSNEKSLSAIPHVKV